MIESNFFPNYKLPLFYTTILVTIMNVCNLLAFKIIDVFGFHMAMSGFLFPSSFYFLSALSESYGYKETEKTILMVMISQSILLIIVPLAVRIPSPNGVVTTHLYLDLFGKMWKVFISSNLAVGLSFYFSSLFNSRLKVWLLGRKKITRFIISTGIAKLILVSISYPINFYGILSAKQILIVCVNTWIFKMIAAAILSQLVFPLVRLNKRIDKVDMYDFNISYRPFSNNSNNEASVNMYGRNFA